MVGAIPSVMESIVLPIIMLILVFKLNPNKPVNIPVKWGLITGTTMLFVFWLTNSSIWISIQSIRGWDGITNYPINTLSFILTVFGLLALATLKIGTKFFSPKRFCHKRKEQIFNTKNPITPQPSTPLCKREKPEKQQSTPSGFTLLYKCL